MQPPPDLLPAPSEGEGPEPDVGNAAAGVALPAGTPEVPRPEARKTEFAPALVAAQESRAPAPRIEPAAAPPADAAPLAAEPGTPAFREGFSERVTILTRGGRTEAGITLHPADLGPIDVRIRIEDGTATFRFDAPVAETRQAIQDSLPRLAEMLADAGLTLGGTQVGHPGRDGGEPSPFAGSTPRAAEAPEDGEEAPAVPVRHVRVAAPGRVDLFA